MTSSRRYARIAITLPQRDLAAADRLAVANDRSRSWVIAEAIRRYAAPHEPTEDLPGGVVARPGLGPFRLDQLTRDLALSPEERVRAAEETASGSESSARPRSRYIVSFDRVHDYLSWKRQQDVGR